MKYTGKQLEGADNALDFPQTVKPSSEEEPKTPCATAAVQRPGSTDKAVLKSRVQWLGYVVNTPKGVGVFTTISTIIVRILITSLQTTKYNIQLYT